MMRLLLILSVALIAGCAQKPGVVVQLTRAQLAGVDQPLMQVVMPSRDALGTVVIAGRNGEVITWQTSDNRTMAFDHGVLVATRGLGEDLMSADVAQARAILRGGGNDWAPRIHSYLDGENQQYFTTFQCRALSRTPETIEIVERRHATTHVVERCVNDDLTFDNHYWLGRDGVMWQSHQWASPSLGLIETQRLVR